MKFTLSWLRDFLDTDADAGVIAQTLTNIGLEVESSTDRGAALRDFMVAEIIATQPHPDADKLQVCRVYDGERERQIVCGAPNARRGIKVVLAVSGVIIPNGGFKIKPSKIRGVESDGMLCSLSELALGEDSAGIAELPYNTRVGTSYAEAAGLNDTLFDIAITPNRGDCLGVYGIARDLAAAGIGTLKKREVPAEAGTFDSPISVTIASDTACTAFAGCVIQGIDNSTQTPDIIRARLEAIGARIISPAVDITNYMLHSFGRPLHVFDADRISGGLVVRQAQADETITALDEQSYTLNTATTIVSDDADTIHAIAGIIGGTAAATLPDTRNVFLEVAMFTPERIARTGRALNIHTDSRARFERYVDPAFALEGLRIAADHITKICGGQQSRVVTSGDFAFEPVHVSCKAADVTRITAISVDDNDVRNILESLGFIAHADDRFTVPSWRPDVTLMQDAVEEVARIKGYDAIQETEMPPSDTLFPALLPIESLLERRCARVLAGAGLSETIGWSFISDDMCRLFGVDHAPRLANPISSEWNRMRPTLLPNILQTLGANLARRLSDTGLFETGGVYDGITPEKQYKAVAGARIGARILENTHGTGRQADIFDAKADLFTCLSEAGVNPANCDIRAEGPDYYHPGRKATVRLGKRVLGTFGEIHPDIKEYFGIIQPRVVAFELRFEPLTAMQKPFKAKQPPILSDLQASDRDFCFIVERDIAAGEIVKTVANVDKKWVEDVRLFDIYQGKGIPEGKKSVALRVRLRPTDQVLTDKDLQDFSDRVVAAAQKRCGAILR